MLMVILFYVSTPILVGIMTWSAILCLRAAITFTIDDDWGVTQFIRIVFSLLALLLMSLVCVLVDGVYWRAPRITFTVVNATPTPTATTTTTIIIKKAKHDHAHSH